MIDLGKYWIKSSAAVYIMSGYKVYLSFYLAELLLTSKYTISHAVAFLWADIGQSFANKIIFSNKYRIGLVSFKELSTHS